MGQVAFSCWGPIVCAAFGGVAELATTRRRSWLGEGGAAVIVYIFQLPAFTGTLMTWRTIRYKVTQQQIHLDACLAQRVHKQHALVAVFN